MGVQTLRERLCELMIGAAYEDLSTHHQSDVDEAMQAIADRDTELVQILKAKQHVYNVKSTDGVMNEPNTGVIAVPVEAIDVAIQAIKERSEG